MGLVIDNMQTLKIECDSCNGDLTTTTNCVGYRLALKTERIPTLGGYVTLAHIAPYLDRDYHFCGVGCLTEWIKSYANRKSS